MAKTEITYEIDDTGPIWVQGGWIRWFENFLPIPYEGMQRFWLEEARALYIKIAHDLANRGEGKHKIRLRGHSRGGAVAMYVAWFLQRFETVYGTVEITGSPRMWFGHKGRRKDAQVREEFTVISTVATSDPVTWVPPFWHHTESTVIDSGRWPRFAHHMPDHYEGGV